MIAPSFVPDSKASLLAVSLWSRFPCDWSTALAVALATLEGVA